MKYHIENLNATLMHKNTPLYHIIVESGELKKFDCIPHDPNLTPFVMRGRALTLSTLNRFIASRIVPDSPQRLPFLLKTFNLPEYTWDGILAHTYGLDTDDYHWLNPADNPVDYEDIKIRDVCTPEETRRYRESLGIYID